MLSPTEDFLKNTLSVFQTILERLQYLRSLRSSKEGKYEHWGMNRTHGPDVVQKMIAEVHSYNFLEALRTSLLVLWEEVQESAHEQNMDPLQYLDLLEKDGSLLPKNLQGGSAKHLDSVFAALREIARAQQSPRPPGS